MAEPFDVAILGATPAGLAAARTLAAGKCSTMIVRTHDDARCNLCDWVGRDFFGPKVLGKTMAARAGAKEFREVCYHNADLTRQVHNKSRTRAGWLLRTGKLVKALGDAARSAGAGLWSPRTQPAIHLEEDCVRLAAGRTIRARLLVVACKRPSDIAGDLSLPIRTESQAPLVVTALDVPLRGGAGSAGRSDPALHVVELPEKTRLGMFFTLCKTLHLRLIRGARAARSGPGLPQMIARLRDAELLPEPLNVSRATASVWRPPAGAALELESHVAKRCLLIGTAGGFADATTGQTLSVSVQSALLAARTVMKALDSSNCQSVLMSFNDSWRASLADLIRPPNTSLQLLLPLLFTNQRITARFTAALLNGKNI